MNDKSRLINPIWIKTLTDDPTLIPEHQTVGSAGCDLRSAENVVIPARRRFVVGTGLKLEIPVGYAAQVCPRSGLAANKGITVLNAPGILDFDYRGEIKVILYNSSDQDFIVKKGDRIAQLVFFQIIQAIFQRVDEVASTDRGEGGLGSTGV